MNGASISVMKQSVQLIYDDDEMSSCTGYYKTVCSTCLKTTPDNPVHYTFS